MGTLINCFDWWLFPTHTAPELQWFSGDEALNKAVSMFAGATILIFYHSRYLGLLNGKKC